MRFAVKRRKILVRELIAAEPQPRFVQNELQEYAEGPQTRECRYDQGGPNSACAPTKR